jgi:hypothetical protein
MPVFSHNGCEVRSTAGTHSLPALAEDRTRVRRTGRNRGPRGSSHTGLNITNADWDIMVKALVATLDQFKVPEKE